MNLLKVLQVFGVGDVLSGLGVSASIFDTRNGARN
jgi:hypothetical protein